MASFVNNFLNEARINNNNPNFEIQRKEIVRGTEMVKAAAAVVIIATLVLFASFASVGMFCLMFPIAYAAYEIGTLANNYQKIFQEWQAAVKANLSDRQFLLHMTERAPVCRSILKIAGSI